MNYVTSRGPFQSELFYDSVEGSPMYSGMLSCKASIWLCSSLGLHGLHREHQPLPY